ncbi:MAG TPA: hypothetical protein VNL91_06540 [Thermoanaerobaculia bacterium]|nr:hypothetical protein [Thermoanaerobaculia bacterium]
MNEPGAAVCSTCGLILLNAVPKRRAADQVSTRRRVADVEMMPCPFCEGTISARAVRCRYCAEVVNDDYYRERARRIRSRLNYASWVAYLFGLGVLLLFRPVGLLSIAAGLVLSIVYYAIPAEPPPSRRRGGSKSGLGTMILRQLRLERAAVPIPMLRNKKLIFVGTPLVAALIGYSANLLFLQEPMNDILERNEAFRGMKVSTHYRYWVIPGVVVYDLRTLSLKQTPLDVHTAFLEFAKSLRDERFARVELSYQGVTRFSIDGEAFRKLGDEYARRNFDYVLYRLPRLLRAAEGTTAPSATAPDRDALLHFHRQWYGSDALTRSVGR